MLDAQFLLFISKKKKKIKCRGLLMTCHAIKTGLNRISIIYINCTLNCVVLRKGLLKGKLMINYDAQMHFIQV